MRKYKSLLIFLLIAPLFLFIGGCKKNQTPEIPKVPQGLTDTNGDKYDNGYVDTSYIFYTDTRDAEDEDIAFKFNWGDGTESNWSEYITSGETFYMSHSYSMAGTYKIKAKSKDIHNNETDWSSDYEIIIISKSAAPFNPSIIPLVDSTSLENPISFKVCAIDTSSNDSLKYQCQWGSTLDTTWRYDFKPSGDTIIVKHTYLDISDVGIQVAKVRAKDQHGSVSEWSAPCTITVVFPPLPTPPTTPKLKDILYPTYYWQTPFTFSTTGDTMIKLQFIWGDGKSSSWVPGEGTGEDVKLEHSFVTLGICSVVAITQDKFEQSSLPSLPYEIDIQSNFLAKWGSNRLNAPIGITISNDILYVVDHNNKEIKTFDKNGNFISAFGSGVLESPMYIAADSGFVYVTDAHNFVCKFQKTGAFVAKWGQSKGTGNGEFDFPCGIVIDSNYVYIVDSRNLRIQKLNKDGSYEAQWSLTSKASGMTITGDTLYVACNFGNIVKVFRTTGEDIGSIGNGEGATDGKLLDPCDVAVYEDYVYVVDTDNARIQKFTKGNGFNVRWGCNGSNEGQFNAPQGIVIDDDGNIYVSDTINNRIQKFKAGSKGGTL